MADNTELNAMTGGDVIAADDVTGVKYQQVKLVDGTLDSTTVIAAGGGVEAGALRVTVANDSTGVLTVDGSVTATSGTAANLKAEVTVAAAQTIAVTNAGTFAVQAATHAVTVASAGIASGAIASGAIAAGAVAAGAVVSGAILSGAVASGAIASGAIASGAVASGAIVSGAIVDAIADDAAFTVGTSRTFPIGCLADETSPDSVDEGDIGVPRMTLTRLLRITNSPYSNGESLDIYKNIDLDETDVQIKATAGKLYGYYIYNNATTTRYVRFYNSTAANTTVGTTASILVIPVPAGAAANCEFSQGIGFSTALTTAATTGVADNDTGAPAANDVVINVLYK